MGRLISEAVQGIRRKGALLSSGAIFVQSIGTEEIVFAANERKENGVENREEENFSGGKSLML